MRKRVLSSASQVTKGTNLIGHDHEVTITQARDVIVLLALLESENLLDVLNLLVLEQLLGVGFADIEQLSTEREHAIVVSAHDGET